jgi:hypothetical protein
VLPSLLTCTFLSWFSQSPGLAAEQDAAPIPERRQGAAEAPADAAGLTALLLERKDDADPELVRKLANLRSTEALDGLLRFYDVVGSLYMRRIALHGFALFDGVPEAEAKALQKLTDIATLSFETELRETAVDELAGCDAGRPFLAAIVASPADDAVRERALRHHVGSARPEDVEWYLRIWRSGAKKEKEKEKDKKEKDAGPEIRYTAPLKELAFEGLAASRTSEELVEATESKLVLVRKRALEELAARRDPATAECAEKRYGNHEERPDVRLLAAQLLLQEKGPKFADRLYKGATRGDVPLELAFGLADLLAGQDDPGLKNQVLKSLGQGQSLEKRFNLRMATRLPDPKVDKALLALCDDKEPAVALDALRAMGLRGNPTFVPRLEKVLKEEKDPAQLGAALESLNRIQGTDPAWRTHLAELTAHPAEIVRNAAVEALGKSKDTGQLEALLKALDHPSWTTRLAAARALEELHLEAGVGALCERVAKEEGRMASELADVLWRLTAQPFRADGTQWKRWWDDNGASFRFPSAEEFQARKQERELREAKQVSRSFRGVKVDSRFFGLRITSHHVAFVIDVSGSMEERVPGKGTDSKALTRIEVAREELIACMEALEAGTRFNILPFSNSATPWKEGAVECTEETFTEAKEFVEELGALGGTNIHDGFKQAFADPTVDTIFFLSDGEPSVGEVIDPVGIREAVQTWNENRGVVIHTISIGDRFPLLEWLAADSKGTYRTYP